MGDDPDPLPTPNPHPHHFNIHGQSFPLIGLVAFVILLLLIIIAIVLVIRSWIRRRCSKKEPSRKFLLPTTVEEQASTSENPSLLFVAWTSLTGTVRSFRSRAGPTTFTATPEPQPDKLLDAQMDELEAGLKTDGPQSFDLICAADDLKRPTGNVSPVAIAPLAPLRDTCVFPASAVVVDTSSAATSIPNLGGKDRYEVLDRKLAVSRSMDNANTIHNKVLNSRHIRALHSTRVSITSTTRDSLSFQPTEEASVSIPSIIVTSPSGEQMVPIIGDNKPALARKAFKVRARIRRVVQASRKPSASRSVVLAWIFLSAALGFLSVILACFRIAHRSVYIHSGASRSLGRVAIPFSDVLWFLVWVTPLFVAVQNPLVTVCEGFGRWSV